MKIKNKFHLTLVILITMGQSLFGINANTARALTVDTLNNNDYNLTKGAGVIYNIYNINNIYIKYIGIKLYNVNIYNQTHKKKLNMKSMLTMKDKIELLMYSIKQIESNGKYNDKSKWSSACGAYQYMPITWDNYGGFKTACLAPEWIQDRKMRGEITWGLKKYNNDLEKVIASHYMPSYAYNKNLWNTHYFKGQPTIRQYVENVEQTMNHVVASLATT